MGGALPLVQEALLTRRPVRGVWTRGGSTHGGIGRQRVQVPGNAGPHARGLGLSGASQQWGRPRRLEQSGPVELPLTERGRYFGHAELGLFYLLGKMRLDIPEEVLSGGWGGGYMSLDLRG